MNSIVSAVYTSHDGTAVKITLADGTELYDDAALPPDVPARVELAAWLAVGNTITAYTPPAPVPPDRISRRQFFLQLEVSGLTDAVDTWVATQPTLVRIAYRESATFERADPMLQDGFDAMGFGLAQVDAFFLAAAAL